MLGIKPRSISHVFTSYFVSMDAFDLFRKLGSGAKFDLKRFGKDAQRFKVGLNAKHITTSTYGRLLLRETQGIYVNLRPEMLPHG